MKSRLLFMVCWMLVSRCCAAGLALGPEPILLWPNGAPSAAGNEAFDQPSIRIYSPPQGKSNGAAVVICPGGGYAILAYDHEGAQVAQRLNEHGVTGIVLQYRLAPRYRYPAPLQDVQRAIRYVRSHAAELQLDPKRVGVMGFSAGGHLASTVSTHFDTGAPDSDDPIERVSCRPDFSILCYAVISLQEEFAHKGSGSNLLGEEAEDSLWENLSNDKQVTAQTPPAFLFHTQEDKGVRAENALAYYTALLKHDVPAELHIYQNGPHGVGLADGDTGAGQWDESLIVWLKANSFLFRGERREVTGTVRINGQPLKLGSIRFIHDNPDAPNAWSMISGGNFSVPAFRGVPVGSVRAEVRNLGDVKPYPTINAAELLESSGIELKISSSGQNVFDLNLETVSK